MELQFKHSTNEGKQPILLLHGWSGSSESMRGLQNALANKGYNVYNIDLPGFGGTSVPPVPYHLDDYVQAVLNFIKDQKIVKPILAGHSFGGKISLKLAAMHPEAVKAVVPIDASGIKPRNSFKKNVLKTVAKTGKKIMGFPGLGLLAKPAEKLFYKLIVREQDYYKSGPLKETFINIVDEHLDELVPKINVPVMLIWGIEDQVTPLWMAERLKELIPDSELRTVPGQTHALPKVQPEIVAQMIYNKFN